MSGIIPHILMTSNSEKDYEVYPYLIEFPEVYGVNLPMDTMTVLVKDHSTLVSTLLSVTTPFHHDPDACLSTELDLDGNPLDFSA